MTEASRERLIEQKLAEYHADRGGTRDSLRVPLGAGGRTLEVIELPLDVPILNADSFRIAPLLADHPEAELVRADPESPAAQQVVASLVRQAHRHVDALKDSLKEGQDQPGVITRKGKLINANTRCVLLRELFDAGEVSNNTIRVAVLPSVDNAQELELESVLQKQREHKDEYNLVSELMMILKLHEQAHMTDAAIAKRLRYRSASRVTDLRRILDLMERARFLPANALPLSVFIDEDTGRDQKENWLELLRRVTDIDNERGREAGNDHIRRWLTAYLAGHDSVHMLRNATGTWVEEHVLPDLSDETIGADGVADALARSLDVSNGIAATSASLPAGLELLGEATPPDPGGSPESIQRLLDITAIAHQAEADAEIVLPSGDTAPADEVRQTLRHHLGRGLETQRRRAKAGSRLQRPMNALNQARTHLSDAVDALEDVLDDPAFQSAREQAVATLEDIADLVASLAGALGMDDSAALLDVEGD